MFRKAGRIIPWLSSSSTKRTLDSRIFNTLKKSHGIFKALWSISKGLGISDPDSFSNRIATWWHSGDK